MFLENVLTEVAELFPGRFIHIGGDEADKREWEKCPRCQQRMKREGIQTLEGLQAYFTQRSGAMLRKLNKRMIGWDEILEGDIDEDAAVMSWRGTERGIAAARRGHDVVMTPASHLYFDHYQNDPATEPKAFESISTLSNVYSFDPVPRELSPEEASHILGVQANLWTEYVPTPAHAEHMALPRMAALSEIAWSDRGGRDWQTFSSRVKELAKTYDRSGWNYSRAWK